MRKHLYSFLSRFYPGLYREKFAQMLVYSADTFGERYWLGSSLLLSFLVFLIFLLYPLAIFRAFSVFFILYGLLGFFAIQFLVYLLVYFKMEDRRERVEAALPDFLQLMAANVRAGMTPFQAMRLSARDEFGPLKEEIQYVTTKALGTENFAQSLLKIRERVHSDLLHRTLELLSSSLKAGGKLSLLLEDLSREVLEARSLRRDLVTTTRSYSLFILFTVLIGAPLLLSISVHFLSIVTGLQASTPVAQDSLLVGKIGISVEFFLLVSYIFLLLTSVLASVLIGVIKEGKFLYGLRFAPFVAGGSLLLFFLFRFLLSGLLG